MAYGWLLLSHEEVKYVPTETLGRGGHVTSEEVNKKHIYQSARFDSTTIRWKRTEKTLVYAEVRVIIPEVYN